MSDVTVSVEQGVLMGKTDTNRKGGSFYTFQGIPYAKPPTGNLRFKDPVPPESWDGVRDATKEGGECYASHFRLVPPEGLKMVEAGSDDCLYLNVYTPEIYDKNASKPVMVYIHGGAFTQGSSSMLFYGPGNILCEDVVMVTTNYRLGALGFLSIDDPSLDVSGNAGLKDMVQALKWIQTNIKQFGGNPNNVTIFGESAGSASVHYLVLSPLAKGLFHKAILQSGVATNTWALGCRNSYKDIAKVLGCPYTDDKKILEFLQSLPVETIFKGQMLVGDWFTPSMVRPVCPTIEKPSPKAFISDTPENIIKSGQYNQVPMIIGYTSVEGLLVQIFHSMKIPCEIVKENSLLPFFYPLKPGTEKYKQAEKKVKKFYFGNSEPVFANEPYCQLAGDTLFSREILSTSKAHLAVQKAPIYFYVFSADTSLNFTKTMMKTDISGACHGDDLGYFFSSPLKPTTMGNLEEKITEMAVKMWTNFAATGDPIDSKQEVLKNTVWKPATPDKFNYLDIGAELKPGVNPDKERMDFWQEIFAFGKAP